MKFRPCIDIHAGKVKQIIGSTLTESVADFPTENFSTDTAAADFARMYREYNLTGGHVIMLDNRPILANKLNATINRNPSESAPLAALTAFPGGLQVGGSITPSNAAQFLKAGASHVIVTSYVFKDGKIQLDLLQDLLDSIAVALLQEGVIDEHRAESKLVKVDYTVRENTNAREMARRRLVLDLSCRRRTANGPYYVVTNKWTKFTDFEVNCENLEALAQYCDEFLVHAVDVEGKQGGIEEDLVALLGEHCPIPVTYAGGISTIADLEKCRVLGKGRVDATVGSALDIFGGNLKIHDVVEYCRAAKEKQ